MSKNIVMRLLADRPIAYHPDIARVAGGVKAGVFLSQLLYWSDKGKREDGYIWKTQEEWETETALTRREQEGARKILKAKGLLKEKREGIPAKLHYKINIDLLYILLDELYVQTSMHETAILDDTEQPNSNEQNSQSITKSTTNYAETTASCPVLSAYEQTFGPMPNKTTSDLLYCDVDEFGETAVIEALQAAKAARANYYAWVTSRLKAKARESNQANSIDDIWEKILKANRDRTWKELPPNILTAVRKVGGESVIRAIKPGYETNMLKKKVMEYVQ